MAEVVSSLVGKVVDFLCGVARQEISYMWNSSLNVENLKHEVENLSGMKGRVQQKIVLANSKGELLLEGVKEWLKKTDDKISEARKFINDESQAKKTCFNLRLCVSLSTVHHYSKRATKITSLLVQHQVEGKDFESCVSLPAPTPGFVDLYHRKNLENINTQKSTLKKIIEALEGEKIQIVGINGLGGVGKTTLAKEVATIMKNRFADIVFVKVSQNVDAKMIKENVKVAAKKIMQGEKVLIILDDVWKELKLEEAGIPCGSDKMNCKILITSRNRDVCEAMNAQKNITLNPLLEKEAWILFERVVGISEWEHSLKEVAMKIVKECGGLPLFILAVGKALRKKEFNIWEATLGRLQNPTEDDAPFKSEGIVQLKLSYEFLENEVAKSLFLLCCMFPEDGAIGLKRLTYYGLALEIFKNPDINIQDAKEKVQLAIESLKSSFLLLSEGEDNEQELIKMHDLVRDMAILTSAGKEKFWVQSGRGLKEWRPKQHLEHYKKISLMKNEICKLPDHELLYPRLDTFLVQDNELSVVSDGFFLSMKVLKVLDMSCNKMSSLPQSLKHLKILRFLDLSENGYLCEISILGELTNLDILKLRGTGIINIPKEIGQLTKLRLLDVYSCESLSYVTPGVMSKMVNLEELYVGLEEGECDFLQELSDSLKILHLKVPKLDCHIPEDFHFETLAEFLIEDEFFDYPMHDCKRVIHISDINSPLKMRVMKLIRVSERLNLWRVKSLSNVLSNFYLEGCDKLKCIELVGCDNVRSLVKTCGLDAMQTCATSDEVGQIRVFSQVEKIELYYLKKLEFVWDKPGEYISSCNLTNLTIGQCASLLNLFPLSVAQGLVNLRDIRIESCYSLTAVISAGDMQTTGSEIELVNTDTVLMFTNIHLYNLPKLESFYAAHSTIKYPSLKFVYVEKCPNMKRWSNGDINHMPNLDFDHQGRAYSNINDYINAVLPKLTNGDLIIREKECRDDTEGYHLVVTKEHIRNTVRMVWFDEFVDRLLRGLNNRVN